MDNAEELLRNAEKLIDNLNTAITSYQFGKYHGKDCIACYDQKGDLLYFDDGIECHVPSINDNLELCNNQEIDLIERLPGVPFRKNFVNESECGICRDEFKEGETIKVLKCNHLFHRECLGQWLINNKKCIICEQLIKL